MIFMLLLFIGVEASAQETIKLYPGYVSKITCEGRVLISAIGNEALVKLDPFPKELGCAVLLKPLLPAGRTNFILETSAGASQVTVEIQPKGIVPHAQDLKISLKGDQS